MVRAVAALAAFSLVQAASCIESRLRPSLAKAQHEVEELKQQQTAVAAKPHPQFLERPKHGVKAKHAAKEHASASSSHKLAAKGHHAPSTKKVLHSDEAAKSVTAAAAAKQEDDVVEEKTKDEEQKDEKYNADDVDVVQAVQQELAEVKQTRDNVQDTEAALKADVAMLRETTKLHRIARSGSARKRTKRQVERGEKLVKVATSMVEDSRAEALEGARKALTDATAMRKVADELYSEAHSELRHLGQK